MEKIIKEKSRAAISTRADKYKNKPVRNANPEIASTQNSLFGIFDLQDLHFPFKNRNDKRGMSSLPESVFLQLSQWDLFKKILS